MLNQLVLSGCPTEPFADVSKEALWGGSPWLQQPVQDRQDTVDLMAKAFPRVETAARHTVDSQLDEADPDGQEDVGSEIYERVVRFVNEISSEESDSDSRTTATEMPERKIPQSSACWMQAAKDSNPGSYNGLFQPTWGHEVNWIDDTRNEDRWKKGSKTSFWML